MALLVSACGGGGGGDDPPANQIQPTVQPTHQTAEEQSSGLRISSSSVLLASAASQSAQSHAAVSVEILRSDVAGFLAGYAPGITPPSWLDIQITGSGSQHVMTLIARPSGLAAGTYLTSVRLVTGTANGTPIGYRDINVRLTVVDQQAGQAQTLFSLSNDALSVHARLGSTTGAPIQRQVDLNLNRDDVVALLVSAPPDSPMPSWLAASTLKVGTTWRLTASILQSGSPGTQEGIIRLVAINADGQVIGHQDVTVTRTLTNPLALFSGSSLSIYGVAGANMTLTRSFLVLGDGHEWTLSTTSSAIQLSQTQGQGTQLVTVQMDLSGLTPISGSIYVNATSNRGDSTQIEIPVSIVAPTLSTNLSSLLISGINGQNLPEASLRTSISNNTNPTVTVTTNKPWLTVTSTGNRLADGIVLTADPSQGLLASGRHSATVTISVQSAGLTLTKEIPLTLDLTAASWSVPSSLALGGTTGRDFTSQPMGITLTPLKASTAWRVSNAPSWVSLSKTSGVFSSSFSETLSATPIPSLVPIGTTSGTITLTTQVNGDTITTQISVSLAKDQHRLIPQDVGVAFTSTPQWQRLSREILVRDNLGQATTWTATSNQSWLRVTGNGRAGEKLTVTADPAGLAADQYYTGTVTLSAGTSDVQAEQIQVGLWVGSTTPSGISEITNFNGNFVADPIRPLIYTMQGGSDIVIYNQYTGAEVGRIAGAGGALGRGLVSPDGQRLYVADWQSIVVVDLVTRTVANRWSNLGIHGSSSLFLRPNGRPMLLLSDTVAGFGAYDAQSGVRLTGVGLEGLALTVSADQTALYGVDVGVSPGSAYRWGIDHSAASAATALTVTKTAEHWNIGGNASDVAASLDGQNIFTAAGGYYAFPAWDGTTLMPLGYLQGDAYPNNVEIASDGRLFAGISSGWDTDLWIYRPDGSLHSKYLLRTYQESMLGRTLKASGDAMLAITVMGDKKLKIIAVGP
ncbi:MAG TPA: hypothetical protein H9903_08260 [Candidatus Aquabacterium excrementipullorum]|nr:hypothetical protein [Candidatus Aquabacterium excrementipullorum]